MPGRKFTIIAGPTAFEFVAAGGDQFLSTKETLGVIGEEVGARKTLVSVRGYADIARRRHGDDADAHGGGCPTVDSRT